MKTQIKILFSELFLFLITNWKYFVYNSYIYYYKYKYIIQD